MKRASLILSALILLSAVSGCGTSQSSAAADEKAVLVEVETAGLKSIRSELSYPGQIRASESVAVISKVAGRIDEVFFDTGDKVKAGDVLFTIETSDIESSVKAARAQLGSADAAIRSAQTAVAQAGTEAAQARQVISQRELTVDQARLAYDNALKNYENVRMLFDMGDLSQNDLDMSETALSNARITVAQAESALEQTVSGYSESGLRAADALAQAVAQRESVLVSLEAAEERLEDAMVKAPIDGVIGSRNADPHMMLSTASVPFVIVRADTAEVREQITETLVNRLKTGDTVFVFISAAGGGREGRIATVSPAADAITSAFEVRVEVDNRSGEIKPGMYAEVFFTKDRADDVLVLPRGAVVSESGAEVVYTAKDGKAVRNEVITGIDTGEEIEIISGINAGDTVIIKGQNYLRDGSPIRIEESRGDAA